MNCVICETNDSVEVATVGRYDLPVRNVICKKCGLVYVDPQPSKEELENYYDTEFRKKHVRRNQEERDIKKFRNMILEFLSNYLFEDMHILEIGCADGALLNAIDKTVSTKNLYGVEPTSDLAAKARENFGVNVFTGLFEDYISDKKFDLIIMQHVLEHCADPLETLRKIRSMLSDKGVLFVDVPNARRPYGDFTSHFLQVPHLFSFTPKTIKLLFKLAGLRIKHESKGALSFVLEKGDLTKHESINFEAGESYKNLLHFFKVYTHWYRSINEKDINKVKENQNEILLSDNELSKEITKMHFQILKNRLRTELQEGRDDRVKLFLAAIEKDQLLSTPESVEFLLMQRDIARESGDDRSLRQLERKIRMIKNMIGRSEGKA